MKRKNKFILIFLLLLIVSGLIFWNSLKTRHKELIKSKVYYTLNLVDSEWKSEIQPNKGIFTSPTFVISDIYKSMEGPKSDFYISIDNSKSDLLYLTSFETKAFNDEEKVRMSNDFVCHTNFEYRDAEHYARWDLQERMYKDYPRSTPISNGVESFKLPEGFGFPVFSDERIFLNAQALNHNIKDSIFKIKHKIEIGYVNHKHKRLIPLQPKTIFMMFPFDPNNPYKGPTEDLPNACIPVETKNHTYYDEDRNPLSGHWVVKPGRHQYKFNTTKSLAIKDSIRLHQITSHLHPFAERFILRDNSTDTVIYDCNSENFKDKIGLKTTPTYENKEGVWLFEDHEYELQLTVNNTSNKDQEMMASMALFFYDKEMDKKIETYSSK